MEQQQNAELNSSEMVNAWPSIPDRQQAASEHDVKMTSVELGLLWSSYMNDSMATCVLQFFLQHIKDADTRSILQHALELSQGHVRRVTELMNQENFPIPKGFTDNDVNLQAPRLYSDEFYLKYLDGMALIGMVTYTAASACATRKDLRSFYNACEDESIKLHNTCLDLLLSKGLVSRPPFITVPDNTDFVDDRSYLTGFFGKRRTLNAIEITNLYLNVQRNALGKALLIGFSQIAQSKKIREFMERGRDMSDKHVRIFSDLLMQNNLPVPMGHDSDVTDSTEKTFSDKLMMFHVTTLTASGIGNYGIAMGSSPRRDLGLTFARLQAEVALYGEDGAEIMIDNAWLEEPPMSDDRKQLARQH